MGKTLKQKSIKNSKMPRIEMLKRMKNVTARTANSKTKNKAITSNSKTKKRLGAGAQACNPSTLGGQDGQIT